MFFLTLGNLPWPVHAITKSQVYSPTGDQSAVIEKLFTEHRHTGASGRHQEGDTMSW